MGTKNKIIAILTFFFSKEITVILVSALPIFELRLALPLAILKFNFPDTKAIILSIFGNILPVIPFMLFLNWAFNKLEKIKFIGKILKWWFAQAEKKSKIVETYGFWGLVLFVAVPFVGTGAWTGCLVAKLLNFNLKKAFFAIFFGVVGACIIVYLAVRLTKFGISIFA